MYDTEQKAKNVRKEAYHGQTTAQNEKHDFHGILSLA